MKIQTTGKKIGWWFVNTKVTGRIIHYWGVLLYQFIPNSFLLIQFYSHFSLLLMTFNYENQHFVVQHS